MHYLFVDPVAWPYRIDAPLHRPIGGTQSALCYLMQALAKRGHRVSFINAEPPHIMDGVHGLSFNFQTADIADADAIIVASDTHPDTIHQFARYAPHAKKILWMHHAADQPAVSALALSETLAAWDQIIFVSDWQESQFLQHFPALHSIQRKVLRNAIAPAFENLFSGLPILACKSPAPRLAYASTPFRGLDRLLFGWHRIVAQHPHAELQIFSDMKLYNDNNSPSIENLLTQARQMPGITHVGVVGQPELADALRTTLILAYPNTFAETACIAVMQAMAAGCIVITSDYGALPETLARHGILLPVPEDGAQHAMHFADVTSQTITQLQQDWQTGALEQRLTAQVEWANKHYSWATRAAEWEAWLAAAD